MNKNIVISLIAVIVIAIAGFTLMGGSDNQPAENQKTSDNNEQVLGQTHTISYTDEGFSPQNLTIKLGDTVVFENNSSISSWPASNDHPVHNAYSEFDSNGPVEQGNSYSFTFQRTGEWGYHDHLKPRLGGTITVE